MGAEVEAILLTHTHFDHIGARRAGGEGDRRARLVPRDRGPACSPTSTPSSPGPASAPSRTTRPTTLLKGGEKLELAGLDIDVIFTPGHSPGHVTFSIPDEQAIFSGDVLFQGSVGRVDLPGGDSAAP